MADVKELRREWKRRKEERKGQQKELLRVTEEPVEVRIRRISMQLLKCSVK